jgi:hypothetical protein
MLNQLSECRKLVTAQAATERFGIRKTWGSLRLLLHCIHPVAELKALKTAVKLTVPGVAVVETLKLKLRGGVC